MSALHLFVFVNLLYFGWAQCPAGWAQRHDSCYYIFPDKLSRIAAESRCEDHAADLVTFANESEWSYVSSLVTSVQLDSGVWTGLTYGSSGWAWPYSTYTELYHWRYGTDSMQDPHSVPQPDSSHTQAKITLVKGKPYLMVELASTLLHPFCIRTINARDACDEDDGWTELIHGCHKPFPPATWSDAVSSCGALGGKVFSPNSDQEISPATTLTRVNTSMWIGASYVNSGYYFADDNSPVDYLPWLPGSNYTNQNQTCMAGLHTKSDKVGYYMTYCNQELAFICRIPVVMCPIGWYQDSTKCFRLHIRPEERVTWPMAVDYCRSHNAKMATVDLSADANTMLFNLLHENDVHLSWLGFSGDNGRYYDINGQVIKGSTEPFDTTNNSGGPSRCGVTDFDPRRTELFLASYCYIPQPFVCTMGLNDNFLLTVSSNVSCDTGWILFNDQCYKINMTPMTYDSAVDTCQSLGASIMLVNSSMQQSFFSTQVFMLYAEEHYWIGIKYVTKSNQYIFESTNEKTSFWNFDPNQQYNASYAPCVYVSSGTNPLFIGSWFAELCGATHNFVCQKPAQPATTLPETTPTQWSSLCGIGWLYSNITNLCYFISPYDHKSWREARAQCQAHQGDLLSIGGEDEQQVIESILTSDQLSSLEESLWIGAGDMTEWNGWSWSDSKPFRYLHWAEGEPEYDSDDGDNCGYIPVTKNFEWETRSCGDKLGFICRKSASQASTGKIPTPTASSSCQPQTLISGTHSILFPQDFSASSYKDAQHTPDQCRMIPFNKASWSPATDSVGEWLAVTFHSPVIITEIELRGEDSTDKYVSKFKLQYQYDAWSPWYWYTETNGSVQIFDGVSVPDGSASIYLIGELQAHAIKIWPLEWSFGIAIQLELNGCPEEECVPDYAMSGPLFVDDRNIRASSELTEFEAWNARLKPAKSNQQLTAWMPLAKDQSPWIQVDLGKKKIIQGITVAGDSFGNYVTSFMLLLSQAPGADYVTYQEPYGVPHTFSAMTHVEQSVTVYLQSSVEARIVRIVPTSWNVKVSLKFDVLVCFSGCNADPMIATLPSGQLSASDNDASHLVSRSKLYTQKNGEDSDCWKPLRPNHVDASYIQVDLGTVMQITAVATQGSEAEGSWVTSYNLAFSTDGQTFRRYGGNVTFYTIANAVTVYNDSVVYSANFDGSTVVKNELAQPVNARYVQLWPHGFHTAIALRWEVYACSKHTASTPLGCYADDPSDPDLPYVQLTDQFASMWPEACLSYCYDKGYRYAGLQNGTACSCGNFYGLYGTAQGCNISCQEPYSNFTCGGLNKNMVFSTGISGNSSTCPPGWTAYKSSCYSIVNQFVWSDARNACQNLGAHLVDIADKGENELVASMVGGISWREFIPITVGNTAWIGLNDMRSYLDFEWSSGADVNFTSWGRHQPTANPGLNQRNVYISPDGSWSNSYSGDTNSFVCETAMKPSSDAEKDPYSFDCSPEWYAGDLKCYRFYRQKSTWAEAQAFCASINSSLARAENSNENIVLSSLLAQLDGRYWVNVLDVNSTGLYTHFNGTKTKFNETSDVMYTNWAWHKPDASGRCVSVQTGQHGGEWTNEPCQNRNRFVCELPRSIYFPVHVIIPNITTPCAQGWELHGNYCYQFNVRSSSQLTWHEANQNCIEQGATLASFHNDVDFSALVAKFSKMTGNFWIGLNNLYSSMGYKWSDNSVMNFIRWGDGQPRTNDSMSVCGEIIAATRTMGLQICNEKRNWICGVQRGIPVHNITTDNIPEPENLGACHPLSNSWYKYKDYCYYISNGEGGTDDALTWRESREWCEKQGADLASISRSDENAFLWGMLNHGLPIESAWIGLNELDRNNGYSWSDGTPIGSWLMNWNVNEPDDFNGFEGCVEMLARNGKWNDDHCSIRQGYICKQPAPGVNVTKPIPVKRHDGNCPPNFSQLGYKCYRLMGIHGDLDKQSWADSQSSCKYMLSSMYSNYTVDLASITSQQENAFVTTLLSPYKLSAWLGLKRLPSGQYVWTDNEDLGFENWNKDEPNMPPGNDSCVYIDGTVNSVGTWNDVHCEEKKAYVCQGFVDPMFPAVNIPPSPLCNVTDGFQQFGNSCYKVVNLTCSWQDAQASCSHSQAYLASIMDGYDWAALYLLSHAISNGVWIGLSDQKTQGRYTWDSGYQVTYTRWVHHQPKDINNGGCVYMDSKGLFNNSLCTDLRAFVCRKDETPPSVTPPSPNGFCNSPGFILLGSTCYQLVLDKKLTYAMAGSECEMKGADLASIHNQSLTFTIPHGQSVWIGLRESKDEGFSWEDSSVLDQTHWGPGQPSWSGNEAIEEGCVVLYGDGTWANINCENKNGYLCSVPATPQEVHSSLPPVTKTPSLPTPASTLSPGTSITPGSSVTPVPQTTFSNLSPKSQKTAITAHISTASTSNTTALPIKQTGSSGLSGGDIAGIVIGVLIGLAICAAIIFVLLRYGFRKPSFLRREASRVKDFENSLYAETHKDTLTKSDHLEGINIVAMEADPRSLSVSYSVSGSDDVTSPEESAS